MPLAPHRVTEQITYGEQLYQRNSHPVAKVLGPTTDFPTWGSSEGTENPKEFNFEDQWDLITELPQDWGNRLLEGTNKTCAQQDPGERSSKPTGD